MRLWHFLQQRYSVSTPVLPCMYKITFKTSFRDLVLPGCAFVSFRIHVKLLYRIVSYRIVYRPTFKPGIYVTYDLWLLFTCSYTFYRAMHFSAKRDIAIACRLSVCLTLVNFDHISWNSSKIISPLVSLGRSLFATPT